MPIVNVNVGENASLQIVDLSTNLNIQSHTEEVLLEKKNAYLANPRAFMDQLSNEEKQRLSELQPLLKLMRKSTITPGLKSSTSRR